MLAAFRTRLAFALLLVTTGLAQAIPQGDCPRWSQRYAAPPGAAGLDGNVRALQAFDDGGGDALFAGGDFGAAGAATVTNVARWDGTSWSAVGTSLTTEVRALHVFDDGNGNGPELYAGGHFTSPSRVARWDGAAWQGLGSGTNAPVFAFATYDEGAGERLFVGGNLGTAGGVPALRVARWDGASWSDVGGGVTGGAPTVWTMATFDDGTGNGEELYVGGLFSKAGGPGGIDVLNVAKWDGTSWHDVGGGLNSRVWSMATYDDGNGEALYIGGDFNMASGNSALHVVKWDGANLTQVGAGIQSTVNALVVHDDGTGGGPALYAGGIFLSAGGSPANRVAKWDGTSWTGLAAGTDSTVLALEVFDDGSGDSLYAGGVFDEAGGHDSFHIAEWKAMAPIIYCTPKSGLVCGVPAIGSSGSPSATATSGFEIFAGPARQNRTGLILYSNAGRAAIPFQGGILCVQPAPLKRTTLVPSGGTHPCDGQFRLDMNTFASGGAGGNPEPYLQMAGTIVNAQWWGRDSLATGSFLSDALDYAVCP